MRHHFIDHYWNLGSPIHRLDPRVKIVLTFLAVFAVVITPNGRFVDHIFFVPLLLFLLIVSKLPFHSILKRMAVIVPLAVVIAASLLFISPGRPIATFKFIIPFTITDAGVRGFGSVVIKAMLATWIMTLVTATTRFADLVSGMQDLKLPRLFTSIIGFMYRFIFLFIDEAEHLNIGRQSRSFGKRPVLAIKGFGWMIASLLLRSFERGERVFHAMCARGFNGLFMTTGATRITPKDIAYSAIFVLVIIVIKLVSRGL